MRVTKTGNSLCKCEGWSVPLLFANPEDRFSLVEAQIILTATGIIDKPPPPAFLTHPEFAAVATGAVVAYTCTQDSKWERTWTMQDVQACIADHASCLSLINPKPLRLHGSLHITSLLTNSYSESGLIKMSSSNSTVYARWWPFSQCRFYWSPINIRRVKEYFFQKPPGQLNSNFIWGLLKLMGVNWYQMLMVSWPRWLSCPYKVEPLNIFFSGTKRTMALRLGMWH